LLSITPQITEIINMKLTSIITNHLENRLRQQIKVRSSFRLLSIASLLFSGICLSTTDAAFADNCKDVSISIKNLHGGRVSVQKVEYKDEGKLRTEFMLGLDGRQFLESNQRMTKIQNLEFVGNEQTFLKVTYIRGVTNNGDDGVGTAGVGGTGVIGVEDVAFSPAFVCKKGRSITVFLQ
jgi:hypothetical protein